MKKYIKLLPVILYPYAYIIWIILYLCLAGFFEQILGEELCWKIFYGIFIGYQILTLISVFYGAVHIAKNNNTASEAAKLNVIIKAFHIPAYIFHFIVGFLAGCMSVWGIGILVFVIGVNVITMLLTGIVAIGCIVKLKKKDVLSTPAAFFAGIASFLFCVDFVVAIVLWGISKMREKM